MNTTDLPPAKTDRTLHCGDLPVAIGLVFILLATHGGALWDGIFLDDHWQRAASRHYGWGWHDLIESATIDFSGSWNRFWFQDHPVVWRYARPVAMLVVKLEYFITGGCPMGIQALALAWHGLTGWLVYRLACWAGLTRFWAFLAGVFLIIHPHSVITVSWASARNALVNGCFLTAAILTYTQSNGRRLLIPIVLWLLALLSRETGIIFLPLIVMLDACFGGLAQVRRRWPAYLVVALLSLVFLYYRLVIFSVDAVPPVYFSRPSGLSYLPWTAAKLLYLMFALVIYTPMVMGLSTPLGFSTEVIIAYLVMALVMGAIVCWYLWASRDHQGRWFWPFWLLAAFLPVIPVFAAPHFAYLPSIPYAIIMAIMLSRLSGRWRVIVTAMVIAATLWSTGIYRLIYRGTVRSEQLVFADIYSTTSRPEAGSRFFFIDLPVAAAYTPLVLREHWDIEDLEGYTLTLAGLPLTTEQPADIEVIGDHELLVSSPPPGFFSGLTGKMFLRVMRGQSPLKTGMSIKGEEFDTTIIEADDTGIQKLKFTFRRPMASKHYYFYAGTPERPACRLRFDLPEAGTPMEQLRRADADPAWKSAHADMLRDRRRFQAILDLTGRIIRSDLYLTGNRDK